MKATQIIASDLIHTTDTAITGKVTDILCSVSTKEVVFVLIDVTTDAGTAPMMFSPTVLLWDEGTLKTSAHPDDIAQRMASAVAKTPVPVDPTELPSTVIGPFGNTISTSLIAAWFNARIGGDQSGRPQDVDGVWFTHLQDHPIRAHVADIGHISDMVFDAHLHACAHFEICAVGDELKLVDPSNIKIARGPDDTLLLTVERDS